MRGSLLGVVEVRDDESALLDLFIAPIALGAGTPLIAPGGPYRLEQIDGDVWPSATHIRYSVVGG